MKHTILVVEDEKGIRETIALFLKSQGYEVIQATNGIEGLDIMKSQHDIHCIIADIMMPLMDGIEMTIQIRQFSDVPILFLSAKSEDMDKITGLNLGADDYITKPFEPMELIARVHSNLRRYEQIIELKTQPQQNDHQLVVGDLILDSFTKEVNVNHRMIRLTAKEYSILELLMSYPGRIFSAEEIYEKVWKEKAVNTETIMVHIRKLREKIEINARKPQYLKVVWGIGYKIEKEV